MRCAGETDKAAPDEMTGLREWVRPAVRDIAARGAADEVGPNLDAILNPS